MFDHIEFPEPSERPYNTVFIEVRIKETGELIVKGVATKEKEIEKC